MVNVLGEDPTKLTITNASIDKQITLKRDYIYEIENTYLEIGVSGVSLRILFYSEARRCSRQTGSLYALHITEPFEYNDPKDITQRSWYIYNNEVK